MGAFVAIVVLALWFEDVGLFRICRVGGGVLVGGGVGMDAEMAGRGRGRLMGEWGEGCVGHCGV